MPNLRSSEKRLKLIERNYIQNMYYRGLVKGSIKSYNKYLKIYLNSLDARDENNFKISLNRVYSALDKSSQNNVIHKKNAARRKASYASFRVHSYEEKQKIKDNLIERT